MFTNVRTMAEIKDDIGDAGKKLKASVKAAASKVKDPDKDMKAEFVKEESKEKSLGESQSADRSTAKLSRLSPSSIPQYKKILVPDDSSELSDKALSHAIYLSNVTGAEIVMLNIVKDIGKYSQQQSQLLQQKKEEKWLQRIPLLIRRKTFKSQ
jgi:hypothetical protein